MTESGAAQSAARKIGVPVSEYVERRENGQKWCYHCAKWRETSEFNVDNARRDGLSNRCRPCSRAYQRAYLRSQPCSICGEASYGGQCKACYAIITARHKKYREELRPYRRLAWAVTVAARLHRKWLKTARRFFGGIASIAAKRIRTEQELAERERLAAERRAERDRKLAERERLTAERKAARERKTAARRARWWDYPRAPQYARSLDKKLIDTDWSEDFYDVTASQNDGPLSDILNARLWELVGDSDIGRLSEHQLTRLREQLVAEGISGPAVQQSERERLREPERHAGERIKRGGGHGGKRGRSQQSEVTRQHHVRNMTKAQKRADKRERKARQR